MDPSILKQITVSALPILFAITFHEASHGYVANKLGDPTAKFTGRLTLNPLAHIDPVGTVLMPIMLLVLTHGQFMFGYAKPVPINPSNFKDPKRDMALSAAAGPLSNILLAVLSMIIIKFIVFPLYALLGGAGTAFFKPLSMMLQASVIFNVVLAVFNMIPVPPLDGGRVLVGLLPHKQAMAYSRIEPFGFLILILLISTGMTRFFVEPIVNLFLSILL
ncbi:MAG: site-2 protease family protein [Thermodesulfovibrionia bacterium]|nr:site-2 protease family protein [Thermodesulfovibrionia bacterium]